MKQHDPYREKAAYYMAQARIARRHLQQGDRHTKKRFRRIAAEYVRLARDMNQESVRQQRVEREQLTPTSKREEASL